MSINPVSASPQSISAKAAIVKGNEHEHPAKGTATNTPVIPVKEAAVYEKTDQRTNNTNHTYTRDSATLSEISKQIDAKLSNLRGIVEQLFSMQGLKTGESKGLSYDQIMERYDGNLKSFYQNLEVDDATRLKAQQEISEDGFWGVKQTSARAIEFAKALSGGDPSKVAILKEAIEEGYKAAEKSWGGKLPEICRLTHEATLKGLDDWASEAKLS